VLGLPPARYPGLIRIERGRRPHVCGGHRRPRPRPEFTEAARGYGSSDPICSFPTELPDQLERQDENCTHSTTQCDCSARLNDHVQTQYHSPGEPTSTKASKLRTASAQCALRTVHRREGEARRSREPRDGPHWCMRAAVRQPRRNQGGGGSTRTKPAHAMTGSGGYLAKRGSVVLRSHRQNSLFLAERITRA